MRIAIAQLNQVVGDLQGNATRIAEAIAEGERGGADLVVTPELSLCGYPPEDLLLRPAFLAACAKELERLAGRITRTTALIGYPERELPNYTVFDEERYFEPGGDACVFEVAGVRVAVVICEDIWFPHAAQAARAAGAQLVVVPNGS